MDAQKKTPVAYERDREDVVLKREAFLALQPDLDPSRLVFVDESGFRLGSSPRHGWAPRGEDSAGHCVHGKWETVTMLGAIALKDVVVMDNLSAHRNARVRRMIEAAGCEVVFTPPYSPEFNPIEEAWAKIKDIIRRLETRTRDAFDSAVACAIDQVRKGDILGWITHAGYGLNSR